MRLLISLLLMLLVASMGDMKFATDGTFNAAQDMALAIVDPAHPIAGGLSGNVDIASAASDICSTSDIQGDTGE